MTHTPGPWEISETYGAIDGEEDIIIEYSGCPICTVRGTNDMSCIEQEDIEKLNNEVIANALMIVKAVNCHADLLEALEKANECIVWFFKTSSITDPSLRNQPGQYNFPNEVFKNSESAIKKAKG